MDVLYLYEMIRIIYHNIVLGFLTVCGSTGLVTLVLDRENIVYIYIYIYIYSI